MNHVNSKRYFFSFILSINNSLYYPISLYIDSVFIFERKWLKTKGIQQFEI